MHSECRRRDESVPFWSALCSVQTCAWDDRKTCTTGVPWALDHGSHRTTYWTDVAVKDSNLSTIHKVTESRQYLVPLIIGSYFRVGKGKQVGKWAIITCCCWKGIYYTYDDKYAGGVLLRGDRLIVVVASVVELLLFEVDCWVITCTGVSWVCNVQVVIRSTCTVWYLCVCIFCISTTIGDLNCFILQGPVQSCVNFFFVCLMSGRGQYNHTNSANGERRAFNKFVEVGFLCFRCGSCCFSNAIVCFAHSIAKMLRTVPLFWVTRLVVVQ